MNSITQSRKPHSNLRKLSTVAPSHDMLTILKVTVLEFLRIEELIVFLYLP